MTTTMIEAAVRGLLLAVAVGAGLRLLRVTNVPVRKAVWNLVLVASLAMPLLMRWPAATGWDLAWNVPLQTHPAPLQQVQADALPTVVVRSRTVDMEPKKAARIAAPVIALDTPAAVLPTTPAGPFPWPPLSRMLVVVWAAVAGALLLRLLWGLGAAVRLWATAQEISPLDVPEENVRVSAGIPSPVTIGSGIVLPADYREWGPAKLRVVLAHERSHVRQMDFYLQLLAGIYTAIFWFSPLGWWLRRTLASLGEAISDRAGLDAAASRTGYAEIVLQFAAMPRRNLPGVAMARTGNVSNRIERLLSEPLFRRAFAEGRRRAMISLLLIPAALFAVTALIRVPAARAQDAPPPPATAPAVAPEPAAAPTPDVAPPAAPEVAPVAAPALAPVPALAPKPPQSPPAVPAQAPIAPVAPDGDSSATAVLKGGRSVTEHAPAASAFVEDDDEGVHGYDYQFSNGGDSWAFVGPSTRFSFSGQWEGNLQAQIDKARRIAHGSFLWFWRDGKSWVVDDPAIVQRLQRLNRPMEQLGKQQEELGKQQEALGKQQEEFARQQEEEAKVRMPDLSKEMAQLDKAMAEMKAAQGKMMTQEQLGEMQSRLAEMQGRLGSLQGQAGAMQGEFGGRMGELGGQQGALGERQGRLGAEQGRLARQSDREVRGIIDQALHNGTARPVQ
jgi:beta-lactamase regulating signal transducer with metallopeptidase domain